MDTTSNNNLIQGSNEWLEIRKGKFTSSEIYRLLAEPKSKKDKDAGNLSDGAMTYVLEKVHEVLTGESKGNFDNEATVWGVQNESLAREWYKKLKGVEVEEHGFTQISDSFGGSSDGLTENGGIEIKCPFNGAIHLSYSLIESQEYMKDNFKKHYWQCVSNCFINKKEWWDFISFDPRLNYDSGFFCIRIIPTEEDYSLLSKKVEQATKKKFELLEKFTSVQAA